MKTEMKRSGADSGHWLWFLQRLTGAGVLITIASHWISNHFGPTKLNIPVAWSYESVFQKLNETEFRVFYLLFLTMGLFHAFHGLWMIGRDYVHAKWLRTILAGALMSACALFFVWGVSILFANYWP